MNVAWWIGFLGAGVVLGSCSGYSSLGELSGGGGESGQEDSVGGTFSMGAKGGQGVAGMRTTGGAQGTGASPDGVGGNGMVGGSNGTGAVGGDGMGAVGGTTQLSLCMTVSDCPTPPPICDSCADGSYVCPVVGCSDNVCSIDWPSCPEPDLAPCMVDDDCLQPPCVEGSQCPQFVCVNGHCGPTLPGADDSCVAPDGTLRACGNSCRAPDGTAGMCNEGGECTASMPVCRSGPACMSQDDCSQDLICVLCGDGGCANIDCLEGQCKFACPTEFMCNSPMDCPRELPNDACSTGPWECEQGLCTREYKTCSGPAPMQ